MFTVDHSEGVLSRIADIVYPHHLETGLRLASNDTLCSCKQAEKREPLHRRNLVGIVDLYRYGSIGARVSARSWAGLAQASHFNSPMVELYFGYRSSMGYMQPRLFSNAIVVVFYELDVVNPEELLFGCRHGSSETKIL
jgi:hypothetical protein